MELAPACRTKTVVFVALCAALVLGVGVAPQSEVSKDRNAREECSGNVKCAGTSEIGITSRQDVSLNQSFTVTLSGQELDDVGSISLEIAFDSTALQFEGIANDRSGLGLQADADTGVVRIGGFSINGASLDRDFVEVEFTFLGGASELEILESSEVTDPESGPISVGFADGAVSGQAPTLSVPDRRTKPGETINVPVEATNLREVGGARVEVTYDGSILTFTGDRNRIRGFDLSVTTPQAGIVRLSGSSEEGVNPSENGGRIADLKFAVESQEGNTTTEVGFGVESEVTSPRGTPYNMSFLGGRIVVNDPVGVEITEGGGEGLNRTFAATPGASAEAIGAFRLKASASEVSLDSLAITAEETAASGVSRVGVWRSLDDTLEAGSDALLASEDVSGRSGFPSTVAVGDLGGALPAREQQYFFVTVSLTPDAQGEVTAYIADESALSFDGGTIDRVNGTDQAGFTRLPLSADVSALPVELAEFTAVRNGSSVQLTWQTASETNNAGFRVQHSAPNQSGWNQLGYVESKAQGGTATEANSYSYVIRRGLAPGTHQVRLQQVDLDGATTIAGKTAVTLQMEGALTVTAPAPNPTSGQATMSFGVKEASETEVVVYNVLGQQVKTLYDGTPQGGQTQRLSFDASSLPSGTYFVQVRSDGEKKTTRLTVVQ